MQFNMTSLNQYLVLGKEINIYNKKFNSSFCELRLSTIQYIMLPVSYIVQIEPAA